MVRLVNLFLLDLRRFLAVGQFKQAKDKIDNMKSENSPQRSRV